MSWTKSYLRWVVPTQANLHPIQVAARRSGLSPDVIRAWERRYEAVIPTRSGNNRRLYSDEDLERLTLLRRATLGGRRIGDVAGLSAIELRRIVAEDRAAETISPRTPSSSPGASSLLDECKTALHELDGNRLEATLDQAAVELPTPVLIEHLVAPLLRSVGEGWEAGTLRAAHEHLATETLRTFLGAQRQRLSADPRAPEAVIGTPAGQRHELGALMAALSAGLEGWRVTYLGPDLPAEEIMAAARQRGAKVIVLSLVFPADDAGLTEELRRLTPHLRGGAELVVGGNAAAGYEEVLEEIGARRVHSFAEFRSALQAIRYS